VGNGFTRWVDGQWAWSRPELGLTNWERGRLWGRSGILSGEDVFTVRDVFRDKTGRAPQAR
jgi:glutamate-5-semialdehyde dehydrogenase